MSFFVAALGLAFDLVVAGLSMWFFAFWNPRHWLVRLSLSAFRSAVVVGFALLLLFDLPRPESMDAVPRWLGWPLLGIYVLTAFHWWRDRNKKEE